MPALFRFLPLLMFGATLMSSAPTRAAEPFAFKDNDRVVFLGGTFVEREGQFGAIEARLTVATSAKNVTFRNLGWSGDTVWADSRGIFDPPAVGYQRTLELVQELKPTVVFLAYGQNESTAGEAGLAAFADQHRKLARDIEAIGRPRFVFVTPPKLEKPKPPLPDMTGRNANIELYAAKVRELAKEFSAPLVDLTMQTSADGNLTDNGIHYTPLGYSAIAGLFVRDLGLPVVKLHAPMFEALQREIVAKNTLFFHRWRPQNITYLTGFRKHEQGNNAVEIAQFDPLVAQREAAITKLLGH